MTSVVDRAFELLDSGAKPAVKGPHRDRKLLDLCHDAPCMIQVHGVCEGDRNPRVPCHSNMQRHGRGKNFKSHDCLAVPGCTACHHWLDEGPAMKETKEIVFMRALERWIVYRWLHKLVKVA